MTNVGGTVFFVADDGVTGREPWKSVPSGSTTPVDDINVGSGGAFRPLNNDPIYDDVDPEFTAVGNTVYFRANDGQNGFELWSSDGTAATLVDIWPGYHSMGSHYYESLPASSFPVGLTEGDGNLFFAADDGLHGYELWIVEQERAPTANADTYTVDMNMPLVVTETTRVDGAVALSRPGTDEQGLGMAIDDAGRIVVGGSSGQGSMLARYLDEPGVFTGALDNGFGVGGLAIGGLLSDQFEAIAIQNDDNAILEDDQVVAVGDDWIVRYTADGTNLDGDFDDDGKVNIDTDFGYSSGYFSDIAIDQSEKIIVVGAVDGDLAVARYLPNGEPDQTFGDAETGLVLKDVAGFGDSADFVTIDGNRIIVSGNANSATDSDIVVMVLDEFGDPDSSFGVGGIRTIDLGGDEYASDLAVDGDHHIVVVGETRQNNTWNVVVARLTETGGDDGTFDGDGHLVEESTEEAIGVDIDPDGRIVVAGEKRVDSSVSTLDDRDYDFALLRYLPDGTPDPTFGNGGIVTTDFSGGRDGAWSVMVQDDGRIVAVGWAEESPGTYDYDFAVARYREDGSLDASPVGVLLNDSDPNGDALTAVEVISPLHGDLPLDADGTFTYTPANNFVGYDSFSYYATDGVLNSDPVTVTIAVGQVLAMPNGPYMIDEGQSLTLDATGSVDLDGESLYFSWDIGADGYDIVDTTQPVVNVPYSQLLDWEIPNGNDLPLDLLADDHNGNTQPASTTLTMGAVTPFDDIKRLLRVFCRMLAF